ncbi:MAG: SDR family oxidoreductase, partial [Candidatus Omnitrophota bacterium]|nr:SDR family oxidoreductase [Candidatus Omnitrophota bacterium]
MTEIERACRFELDVAQQQVCSFAELSGDRNPLHLDPAYARTTEYGRPIAHGAFLIGLVSRVLGMSIPGRRSLLLSVKAKFPKPLFYPTRVRVDGRLKSFDEQRNLGIVTVVITDLAKLWPVLEAEASFALHSGGTDAPVVGTSDQSAQGVVEAQPIPSMPSMAFTRSALLVTGGTGGIGSRLMGRLIERYDLCCLTRQSRTNIGSPQLVYDQIDLEADGALEKYLERQSPGQFYGVVHLSVPPVPRGFVSDDLAAVRRHLRHGVEVPLLLARWARRSGSAVKRLILCGSTFGSKSPKPQLGAYALGKAAMEFLPRLLTADLAVQGTTVNVVSPTVIPAGLNEGMSQRAQAVLVGKMPTGRLVTPEDVAAVVLF